MIYRKSLAVVSWLLGAFALLSPIAANAQSAGQWTRLMNLPLVPIHEHLLPDGKVLMWGIGATLDPRLWNPADQSISLAPKAGYDLFCSGHTHLADGRLFVAGGHIRNHVGLAKASLYNPATNGWSVAPDMNAGRWYPTATTLANGDVLVVSGDINKRSGTNPLPQVYQAASNTWRSLTGAQLQQHLYPMMFLAPNGKVIDVAPTQQTRYLDTTNTGAWSAVANRNFGVRSYGSAVMYAEGKILVVGGGDPPTASAEVIDLNAPTPAWRTVASMSVARRQLNATLLPDGTVLVTGGTSGPGFNNTTTPVFSAELWNPATETWTTLASASVPRLYHSSALLLADGRVLATGGDNYPDAETFSPPYLLTGGTRPTMSGVPASISYGQSFSVQSPNAADIRKVTLIRLPSVTHGFDQNQRLNALQFTSATTGVLDITAPAHGNVAPPGSYMIFIVNADGVPSIASIVQVGGAAPTSPPPVDTAPLLTSMSPANATAGGPAFTLTVNGSNFVSGAVVHWNGAERATTFGSSTQLTAAIAAADIATPGTAQVSVANPGGPASANALAFTVAAAPVPTFQLTVTRNGTAATRGTITSQPAGINCGGTCSATFVKDTTVTLRVTTNGNGVFAGWSGACTGTGACTLPMDANKAVTATINRR